MECCFFFSTKKLIWKERVVEIHTIKVQVKILLNFYLWVWMMCVTSHSCMWSRVCDTLGLLYLSQDKQVSVSTFSFWECLLFSSIASDRPVSPWIPRILLMCLSISHKCTAVMDVQALPTSFISVLGSNLSLSVVRSYQPSPKIKQIYSSFL